MNFHLTFPIQPFPQKVSYSNKLLLAGSCFAENIGDLMLQYKFNVQINPHGVLFNPASIASAIRRYIDNKPMQENELFFANECWNSWEHHSRFSNTDKLNCLSEINENISSAHYFIMKADWLFITFGSAFVYRQNATGEFAANCHKVSQKEFTKHLLSITEIVSDYKLLLEELKRFNPDIKIIFTVSPVRYIRDGVAENNLSKARLLEAVHELVNENSNSFYFPAYELVIDDLRDYRFYKADLVHPNEQAVDYVFEKLMNTVFDEETKILFGKIKDIITAKQHRPFNSDTKAHEKFKETYSDYCRKLGEEYPFLDLNSEAEAFRKIK